MPKYRVKMQGGDVYIISASSADHAREMVAAARRVGLKHSRKRQFMAPPPQHMLDAAGRTESVTEVDPGAQTSDLSRTRAGHGGTRMPLQKGG